MNWIIALFALCGVMAVLSTIVTVLVQAVNKLLSTRSNGLMRMMYELYIETVSEAGGDDVDPKLEKQRTANLRKNARAFATEMVAIPTQRGSILYRMSRTIPFLGLFERRFERLTKTELIQQLAHTDVGKALVAQDRQTIERTLAFMALHFERFGWAQTTVFRMRAKFFSSVVAIAFVLLANVNAVEIYKHLASDEETYANTMTFLGAREDENEASALETRLVSIETELNSALASLNGPADASSAGQAQRDIAEAQMFVGGIRTQVNQLQSLGLPIGHGFFPYCGNVSTSTGVPGLSNTSGLCANSADKRLFERIVFTPEGWIWLLSIVGTAGLLGLGAPFWFNVFATAATITGRVPASLRPGAQGDVKPNTSAPQTDDPSPARMGDLLLMTAGKIGINEYGEPVGRSANDGRENIEAGAVFETGRAKRAANASTGGRSIEPDKALARRQLGIRKISGWSDEP